MNVRYRVELSQAEREQLTTLLSGGKHAARKLKRAQILLAADGGAGDDEIATTIGVGGSTVYRTKRRFVVGNLEAALSEEPRTGAERKLSGKEEALLLQLRWIITPTAIAALLQSRGTRGLCLQNTGRLKMRSAVKKVLAAAGLLETAKHVRKKLRKIANLPSKHGWTDWTPLVPEGELFDCCENAINNLRERGHVFGDYLEFGVSRGTSLACVHRVLVRQKLNHVRLIGFDSFEGFPVGSEAEGWPEGDAASSLKATQNYLSKHGVQFERTTLVKGWFKETLTQETLDKLNLKKASII